MSTEPRTFWSTQPSEHISDSDFDGPVLFDLAAATIQDLSEVAWEASIVIDPGIEALIEPYLNAWNEWDLAVQDYRLSRVLKLDEDSERKIQKRISEFGRDCEISDRIDSATKRLKEKLRNYFV